MSWTFRDGWDHSRWRHGGWCSARVTSDLKEVVEAAKLLAESRSSKSLSELSQGDKLDR